MALQRRRVPCRVRCAEQRHQHLPRLPGGDGLGRQRGAGAQLEVPRDRIIEENKAEVAAVEEALEIEGTGEEEGRTAGGGEYRVATPLPIPDAEADVIEYSGQLWVSHNALLEAGYRWLESFDVVLINGTYYELQGHVGKGNRRFPGGAWWIEEVDENAEVDVPVLETEEP
jgi:hypothetical protein